MAKNLGWRSGEIEYEVLISVNVNDNLSVTGVRKKMDHPCGF
jgi:hypothetical protein